MAPYLEKKRDTLRHGSLGGAEDPGGPAPPVGRTSGVHGVQMVQRAGCPPSSGAFFRNHHQVHQPGLHHGYFSTARTHQTSYHHHHAHHVHHGTSNGAGATTGVSPSPGANLRSSGRPANSVATRAQSNSNSNNNNNNNNSTTNNNISSNGTNGTKQVTASTRSTRILQQQNRQQQQERSQQFLSRQQQQQQQSQSNHRVQGNGALRGSNDQLGGRPVNNHSNTQDHLCDNSNDSGLGFEERQQQLIKAVLNRAATPITRSQQISGEMSSSNHDRWMKYRGEVQESHQMEADAYEWNGVANAIVQEEKKKRRKMDIKLESEDANFAFPEGARTETKISTRNGLAVTGRAAQTGVATPQVNGSVGRVVGVTRPRQHLGVIPKKSPPPHQGPVTLTSPLQSVSRDGKVQLQIICQPEQQHRARYQTEGSRGAVKDRSGNGFPIVRLIGWNKPTTLQVFIGTDLGRVAPHMFYQACRVSGKNSTPCIERKIDGTIVIEVDMDPAKDMVITCDCVGILKERNVDVEHRFPQEAVTLQGRSKKKSTRCRMVFRTTLNYDDGTSETLQVCSMPIVCTQPPGIPEICKKSLTACPCTGGLELFILGKNFLKDTRIVFQLDREDLNSALEGPWECTVIPDKEFLQQTHLVCVVPPYKRVDLMDAETITVRLFAVSSGKTSEPHTFLYSAASTAPVPTLGKLENTSSLTASDSEVILSGKLPTATPIIGPGSIPTNGMLPQPAPVPANFLGAIGPSPSVIPTTVTQEVLKSDPSPPPVTTSTSVTPGMMWSSPTSTNNATGSADVMMPPPTNLVANPLMSRRPSANLLILPDNLKTEVLDENSQSSLIGDNSMSGLPSTSSTVASPLEQLVNENSRESSQSNLIRTNVSVNGSPVPDALLGVVDIMRNQHQLALVPQQSPFSGLHETCQVKVLSPHNINKDAIPVMTSESNITNNIQGSPGVVDLRMKHHQPEFNGIGNGNLGTFAATPPDQPLPAQSGHSIEKYLEQIETAPTKTDIVQDANFVRASIITSNQVSPNLMPQNTASVPLDELVSSTAETHQMVSPNNASPHTIINAVSPNTASPHTMISAVSPNSASPHTMIGSVASIVEQEAIQASSPQQTTTPPMIMDTLMSSPNVTPMVCSVGGASAAVSTASVMEPVSVASTLPSNMPVSLPVQMPESIPENQNLLNSISSALLPNIQESPIVTAAAAVAAIATSPNHTASNLQVGNDVLPDVATAINQVLNADQMQNSHEHVEHVVRVAQAQHEVQQVVAQVHQQAVQTVAQAQQQVVQQVVAHAQVVQQAVKKVQELQHTPMTIVNQHAVTAASQEAVHQAMQQSMETAKKQVNVVREAVQQAQAAQAMQVAVQQEIGNMLGKEPAGFVVESSFALANTSALADPGTRRLTEQAEQAISNVITNATQDLINNRPFTTTTAEAIARTKNIINNVVTQSAQLMNETMEQLTLQNNQPNIGPIEAIEQATQQGNQNSPPAPIPMQTSTSPANSTDVVPMHQSEIVQMQQTEIVPMQQTEIVPMQQTEIVQMQQTEIVQMQQTEIVQMQQSEVIPMQQTEVVSVQQNNDVQPTVVSPVQPVETTSPGLMTVESTSPGIMKKPEPSTNGMMTQDLMTDTELLTYINSGCFDTQSSLFM